MPASKKDKTKKKAGTEAVKKKAPQKKAQPAAAAKPPKSAARTKAAKPKAAAAKTARPKAAKPRPAADAKPKAPRAKSAKTKMQDALVEQLVNQRVGARKSMPAHHPISHDQKSAHREEQNAAVQPAPAAAVLPAASDEPRGIIGTVRVNEQFTVKDLAVKMDRPVQAVIKKLLSLGMLGTINQRVDLETATLVAAEYGYTTEWVPLYGEEIIAREQEKDDASQRMPRSPVVTVMGHVDHGKTSLLDSIRESDVVSTESGGITQHIGAYKVKTPRGVIVFLDTPGHEAFTAMRARGAQVTDLVVLVVAADDGIKPQTVEAIDHARAAGVPIIVAINKTDLPAANIQRVKQELAQYNLLPEDWGGKTITVEVSAKQRTNIDQLLEMILLQAEMLELKANPAALARGIVVEAHLDSKRGSVATVLVQNGTLRLGESFVAGNCFGKVRALSNEHGTRLKEAPPSTPVEILGMTACPQGGDKLFALANEREARSIAQNRQMNQREEHLSRRRHITLEELNKRVSEAVIKELKVVIKADVQGSIGALRDSLEKLSAQAINLFVIHAGVGGINESDVILAAASDAIIIGFNVRPDAGAERVAGREGVEINTYRVIYEAIADVRAAMEGLLEPDYKEKVVGRAQVKATFRVPKVGVICGCSVTDGQARRQAAKARVTRDGVIVYEGQVQSLKRFKDECGLSVENFSDVHIGDIIEFVIMEKVARRLDA